MQQQFSTFINQLQKLLNLMPMYCPTITMGGFNIDMLDQNSTQLNELGNFMKHYSMELQFKEIITIYDIHIDHIWTNAPTQQCMLGLLKHIGLTTSQYIFN